MIWSLIFSSVISFAVRECPGVPGALPVQYTFDRTINVPFGTHGLKLDQTRPRNAGRVPAIIFLYGGSWVAGSKAGFATWTTLAAQKGFFAVAPNYRLVKRYTDGTVEDAYPASLNDVKEAIAWTKAQPNVGDIYIFGESAGAHLAAMAGLTVPGIKAIGTFYGPSEMHSHYAVCDAEDKELLRDIFGGVANFDNASPVNHLKRSSPPILTLHGNYDDVVLYDQATTFQRRANELGVPFTLVHCPNEVHGFTPTNRRRAFERIFRFFHDN